MGRYPISLASTAIAKKPLFGIAIAKGSVNGPLKREIQFGVYCSSYVKVHSHGAAAAAIFLPQRAKSVHMMWLRQPLFLAKLFPQLCSCHWNGNYDLFSNFVTFLALLWPFCDLFMTFSAILWPFCDFYDLFMTFSALLWPFYEWQKRSQFYEWQNDTT